MNLEDYPCKKCATTPGWMPTEFLSNNPWVGKTQRCDCSYTEKLFDYVKHKNDYQDPVISTEHATICAEMMATIPFFPGDHGSRIAIADEVASMAGNQAQAVWIARRMIRLYSRWPGLAEMRRVFWRTHRALDGIEPVDTYSEHYPAGIPLENANLICIVPGLTQLKQTRPLQLQAPVTIK